MARTADQRAKASALDASLRKMFKGLETRPASQGVASIVEQLYSEAPPPLKKAS